MQVSWSNTGVVVLACWRAYSEPLRDKQAHMHSWSVMLVCVKMEVWLQSRSGQDARVRATAS